VLIIRVQDKSIVAGDLIVKNQSRPVEVYLSGGGEVQGQIKGAGVVRDSI
jgi:hypothetical protein